MTGSDIMGGGIPGGAIFFTEGGKKIKLKKMVFKKLTNIGGGIPGGGTPTEQRIPIKAQAPQT